MFVLSGYDAFLGFLLISAAVPVLALVANKLLAQMLPSAEGKAERRRLDPVQHPLLHVCAGLRHL